MIKNGAVTVNDRPIQKPGHPVAPRDRILLHLPDPAPPSTTPEAIPLDIVYEDADVLVVNKPAGMVVHPACGHPSSTLVNALLHHCAGLSGVGGATRPGIVHRLDKDTSGLLMVAKHDGSHHALADQLAARRITREYVAIVWSAPKADAGTIDAPIGRHPRDRKRMAVVEDRGRPAVTHYRVTARFAFCALLVLRLETGRTHQIRVHLAHLGYPVLGDAVYGGGHKRLGHLPPPERRLARAVLACVPRQALHAAALGFDHPRTGAHMAFRVPLPGDMQQALDMLRENRL